jgi:hypothetical protein
MPGPQDRPPVVWWRLALLLALGATVLFASIPYDDWRLLARYCRAELWQDLARPAALARAQREQRERAERERREARIEGSIRALFTGPVQALARCPDGGLVAGGRHSRHELALAKLHTDGTLDRAWMDRMAAQPIVGGVGAVTCDADGVLVGGAEMAHRSVARQVTGARFSADGALERVYGIDDVAWPDPSRRETRAAGLGERVQQQLPRLLEIHALFGGPGASALVFFDERVPEPEAPDASRTTLLDVTGPKPRRWRVRTPSFALCATGARLRERRVSRAAVFDEAGSLEGAPEAPARSDIRSAERQPSGGWIVRAGVESTAPGAPVLWRVNAAGLDPTFRELRARDLGGPRPALVLTSLVEPDGRIVLAGTFESILGQPRRHIARLRADGTLDE